MKKINKAVLCIMLLLLQGLFSLVAQEKQFTIQEAVLKGRSSLAPKRLQNLGFAGQGQKFSYLDNQTVYLLDAASAKLSYSINLAGLNTLLRAQKMDSLSAIEGLSWADENSFYFKNGKVEWLFNIKDRSFKPSERKSAVSGLDHLEEFRKGELYAYVKDNNVMIYNAGTNLTVTTDGSYIIENGKSVHRDEFGITKGLFWSPKGNALAYYRMDQSDVRDYPIIDWTVYPAENKNIKYPMAGGQSHYVNLMIYHLSSGKNIQIKTEGPKDQYLTNVAWSPDEQTIYIALLNREQNHMRLNAYNAGSGEFIKTLFEEKDERYVEPLQPMVFVKNNPKQFIWQSRRDGYLHLYLYNSDGALVKQLTRGNWEVKSLNGFDEKGECFFFHANAESPVNQDFYAVELKSAKIRRLTSGSGMHTAILNAKGNCFIDAFTSCYTPREYSVVNVKTSKAQKFYQAENPVKAYKTGSWSLFSIKSKDGQDLYCRLFKPVDFDSSKRYPVLVYLYNGPHSQLVTNSWMAGGELWYQYMAQKGYLVFTLDGRGTSYRGKAFEQVIHRQLGTAEMQDQLSGVEYLKSLPYVDANRMGVFGWSYGGFMSTSLMTRQAGTFKVGVAGGPVIDWSYYEVMYGERYMDTPQENPEGYKQNNLLNHVDKLKGRLLMIHGAQDNVVVWQHSMMYLKKAVEKGVQVDYYVYPGHEHNVLGKDRAHLMEKICNYFIENL